MRTFSKWQKTHKFDKNERINAQSLNFGLIIPQTGARIYNTAQIISNYLKPLYTQNKYIIDKIQDFLILS